jgi:DhnA family fructose-bisphosphate aldolase class Ia
MFSESQDRAIVIALDLGVFGAESFITGIEDLPDAIKRISAAGADVLQVNIGGLRMVQRDPGLTSLPIAVRLDATNIYEARSLPSVFTVGTPDSLVFSNQSQVTTVVLNLIEFDEDPSVQARCIALIQQVRAALDDSETMLMVEPLVMRRNSEGIISGAFEASDLVALVRQGVELGADAIKVDAPSDPSAFARLVEVATPIPVLLRGGGKVSERVILERAKAAIDAGARGVVFGRNVVQHPHPTAFIAALRAVVHENSSVDEAMTHLEA